MEAANLNILVRIMQEFMIPYFLFFVNISQLCVLWLVIVELFFGCFLFIVDFFHLRGINEEVSDKTQKYLRAKQAVKWRKKWMENME